jgi:autophagy-related protein 16
LDGGLRFWDVRSGDRVLDIPNLHDGGVTSVHWNLRNSHEVLTNGRDSTLKIVDARTSTAISTFLDPGFRTLTNYASCSLVLMAIMLQRGVAVVETFMYGM